MQKPFITNDDPMDGPAQIDAVAAFAEQGWHFRTGTAAQRIAIPAAEAHNGLLWKDTDGLRGLYGRNATNDGWDTLDLPGLKRNYLVDIASGSANSTGTQLSAFFFGSAPIARRIVIDVAGTIGFAATPNVRAGLQLVPTGGTLIRTPSAGDDQIPLAESARYYPYALKRILDVPANVNSTLSIQATFGTAGNCYYRVTAHAQVLVAGEYV